MKIAATYDNGNIFPHFGRTEAFKIYDVEENKIVSAEIVGSDGAGHGALAGVLKDRGVDLLICGGIGGGAVNALANAGIEVVSGASGNTDDAVEAYLHGDLVSSGTNCDHHEHHGEEHECCGHHDEEGQGGCCGGGCAEEEVQFTVEGINAGKVCKVHYRGTLNDGTQFDSSYDRGEPIEFVCGAGMMIKGFDAAVVNMIPGQIVDAHLMPEDAYGMRDPNAVITLPIQQLPGSEGLTVGQKVILHNAMGQQFPVTVAEKDETMITLDANHELAGQELNFRIELLEVN